MKVQIAALIATLVIVCSSTAFAQKEAPATEKLEFRKWDAGGSVGLVGASRREFGGSASSSCSCGEVVPFAGNIDFGRYFTPHLKAEGGFMRTNQRYFYDANYSYPQKFPFSSTSRSVDPTSVSGAVTYQFFENVFAHPYVSAGIRVTSLHEESRTYVYNTNYSVPPIVSNSSRRFTEVRPFVAAGYKSYFNERVFMRSEVLVAFDKKGAAHGTARLGFGIDF